MADFNILSPDDMDKLLFSPFQQALGQETRARIVRQINNYNYYDGYQHLDKSTGQYVKAEDLPRPPDYHYDPKRYTTNYFKSFIKRKARWQMGGQHGLSVAPRQIDDILDAVKPDYTPSASQEAENNRAENYERLLYRLWDENKMREKLTQAARDRLIAGRVAAKIVFNTNSGRLRWIFRPDNEVIPVYADDDFDELEAVHFVKFFTEDDEELIQKQTFRLEDGECYLEEAVYTEELKLKRVITPKESMGLNFIPVVLFPLNELSGEDISTSEIEDMKELTGRLNEMNEDAADSLRFEMFPMTAFINVPEGTAAKAKIAPGAAMEANNQGDGTNPDIKKIESGFRWKDAFKDQYSRVKGALHEITSLPQVVPQELNFGGLNADALHVLFHDIIQETEEHWLAWGPRLAELHEKSIRYLQARTDRPTFAYDREVVKSIGEDYRNEIKFVLPLPDNRKELVELLTLEMDAALESHSGAMNRLGVENTQAKKQEIANEMRQRQAAQDPYNEALPQQPQEQSDTES